MIFGNYQQQQILKSLLDNPASDVISLVGPSYIGKRSFILEELQNRIHETDILVADNTIDTAREVVSASVATSIYSPFRALVINDADHLSEPAQDAYLKLFEEPSDNLKVILVCDDDHWLLDALHSRIVQRILWNPLSSQDMIKFVDAELLALDELATRICNGRPGLYREVMDNKSYGDFYKSIIDIIVGVVNPSIILVPSVIRDISSKSTIEREIVAQICSIAVRDTVRHCQNRFFALNLLNFASLLKRTPTINAEIYWSKACYSVF